jgi:16S rRNA (guanine527-N7)-methyltransferase
MQFTPDIEHRLRIYQTLLHKWQRSINLVSDSTLNDSWSRHFIDSSQVAAYISKPNPKVLDVGSGAGFPGLVLAIILPEGEFHLVESDKKKCIFLTEVSRETKTKVIIHSHRIESSSIFDIGPIDYITSRACANVSQLFSWIEHFVSCETKCLFQKGKNYSIEIEEAKKDWQFHVNTHSSITETGSAILEIDNIVRRRQ